MHESLSLRLNRWCVIALALLATLFPFYWTMALATQDTATAFGRPRFLFAPNFDAFAAVWNNNDFVSSMVMSALVVTITVALTLCVSVPAAYILTRYEVRGRASLSAWLLLAYLLPDFLVAIPMYALLQNIGLYDSPLGLAISYQVFMAPLAMWLLLRFFADVPEDLADAAQLDGLNARQTLTKVYLPIVAPGVATTAVIVAITVWNEVTIALALTLNHPTVPIAVAGYKGYASIHWDQLAAASVFAMAPVILFAVLAQRQIVSGLTTGMGK